MWNAEVGMRKSECGMGKSEVGMGNAEGGVGWERLLAAKCRIDVAEVFRVGRATVPAYEGMTGKTPRLLN